MPCSFLAPATGLVSKALASRGLRFPEAQTQQRPGEKRWKKKKKKEEKLKKLKKKLKKKERGKEKE